MLMEENTAPVDMVNIPLFTGFWDTSQVVVWDFFHQQYVSFPEGSHGQIIASQACAGPKSPSH